MIGKVLIVDDEISIHASLEFILKQYNVEVLHATDGKEALLQVKENEPDLILMDFKLPGPNGIKITQRIKNHPKYHKIPIVGITAYASDENRQIALKMGIEQILEKPFDLMEIEKIMTVHFPQE